MEKAIHRQKDRVILRLPVLLEKADGTFSTALLFDLSEKGARLEAYLAVLKPGTPVTIHLRPVPGAAALKIEAKIFRQSVGLVAVTFLNTPTKLKHYFERLVHFHRL